MEAAAYVASRDRTISLVRSWSGDPAPFLAIGLPYPFVPPAGDLVA